MKSIRALLTINPSVFFGLLFFAMWASQAFAFEVFPELVALNRQQGKLGGTQTEQVYASSYGNGQLFGYLEYLPPSYDDTTANFPVLISLHNTGQLAEGNQIEFDKIRTGGQLAKRVSQGQDFPFIIITPQQPQDVKDRYKGRRSWDPYLIDEVLEKVKSLRRVDLNRIYICGESMGGGGVWKYLELFGDKIAAAVSIAGTSTTTADVVCSTAIKNTPVWAFHCDGDAIVSVQSTLDMVKAINECNPAVKAKQTIFSSRSHNAWDWVYDFSERALSHKIKSTSFGPISRSQDILSWMFSYRLSNTDNNQMPVAKVGSLQEISSADSTICLDGSQSYDDDGTIVAYYWKQVSGTTLDMPHDNESMLHLEDVQAGTYKFELTVTDDKGGKDADTVMVVVKAQANDLNGLRYAYFEGEWSSLPDFNHIFPVKTGKVSEVNLNERLHDDNFGFVFKGNIKIEEPGEYIFYLTSDEGSKLYIDRQLIVNNDDYPAKQEKFRELVLDAGMHNIELSYFERQGHETLELSYSGPGFTKMAVPTEVLYDDEEDDFSFIEPEHVDNMSDMPEDFVKAYPSYLESELTVEYSGNIPANNRITLYGQSGEIYFTNTILLSPDQLLQIDLLPLHIPKGLIYLKVENGEVVKTVKLLKK